MRNLEIFCPILKEIPVIWWANCVDELSLFIFSFCSSLIFITSIFAFKSFCFINSVKKIIFNLCLDFVRLYSLKTFKQNRVLDILEDHIIDMFQLFGSFDPLFLILLIVVAIPDPISTINLSLFIFFISNSLSFAPVYFTWILFFLKTLSN